MKTKYRKLISEWYEQPIRKKEKIIRSLLELNANACNQPKARETAQDPGVIEFTYHSLVESDVKVLRNKTTPVRSQSFEAF